MAFGADFKFYKTSYIMPSGLGIESHHMYMERPRPKVSTESDICDATWAVDLCA